MRSEEEQKLTKLLHIGELTSRITHDMRNPLTVIINYAMMIRMNSKNRLDAKSLEQLTTMENQARKMYHQIEDILNYVKLAPLKLQNHTIHTILKGVMEQIEVPETIELNLPSGNPSIYCDLEKMEIVLVNLITNAVHAIEEYGEITIRVSNSKDETIIEVEDSGKEIPQTDVDKIFEPLFTTKEEGTGLGLASCKNIIERHKGSITVSNNPTTFTIKLPRK